MTTERKERKLARKSRREHASNWVVCPSQCLICTILPYNYLLVHQEPFDGHLSNVLKETPPCFHELQMASQTRRIPLFQEFVQPLCYVAFSVPTLRLYTLKILLTNFPRAVLDHLW